MCHIGNVTMVSFYHLRINARARPSLSQADTERSIHAFLSIRRDYCNAPLSGASKKAVDELQLILNGDKDQTRYSNFKIFA